MAYETTANWQKKSINRKVARVTQNTVIFAGLFLFFLMLAYNTFSQF